MPGSTPPCIGGCLRSPAGQPVDVIPGDGEPLPDINIDPVTSDDNDTSTTLTAEERAARRRERQENSERRGTNGGGNTRRGR